MSDFLDLNKSIILHMAASLIENLLSLLEEEGTEIAPLEMAINGQKTGDIDPRTLAEEVRKIAASFKPIKMETTSRDSRTDADEGDD